MAERDANYWRMRCEVKAEDVEEAGITWDRFDAWSEGRGLTAMRRPRSWERKDLKRVWGSDIGWEHDGAFYGHPAAWPGNRPYRGASWSEVANFIRVFAPVLKLAPFALLDEMSEARRG